MSLQALWDVTQQFNNKNGSILTSGKIYIYYQGRTALATTYHDEDGTVVNSNPVLLDNNGRATAFVNPIYSYTIVVCDYYGKELFSQDITLHDAISTAEHVVVHGTDGTVLVDRTELPNGVQYDLSVNTDIIATKQSVDDVKADLDDLTGIVNNHTTQIGQLQYDVDDIESDLNDKKDKQSELSFDGSVTKTIKNISQNANGVITVEFEDIDLSALNDKKDKQSELSFDGAATKTIKNISQNANGVLTVEFEDIDLPPEVPNVEITSEDNSIQVTETTDAQTNTKTFDLSVNIDDPLEYGQFRATNVTTQAQLAKIKGNIDLNNYAIKLKKGNSYHFTVRGNYVADSAANTYNTITYIEYSTFNNIIINVDNTITDSQYFEISYDVYNLSSDKNYNVAFSSISGGKVSELWVEVHNLNGVSVNGQGGGTSDNDQVAIDANAVPGYLEDVLVSDSDIVTLVKSGNKLHVQVNTEYTADPKLATCDEADINGVTNNSGSYALKSGYDKLIWNDPDSYQWLNAYVYQMKRLCTSQGTVTKCNLALAGTLGSTQSPAFINCCILNTNGTLLGSTGLRLYGTDFSSNNELVSFDMSEESDGALNLKNNTYYIIQIITCGLQLASLSHESSYNYNYDYNLRMNLQGYTNEPSWKGINALTERASQIPWISFAASPIV